MDATEDPILLFGGADRTQLWGSPSPRQAGEEVPADSQDLDRNHPWEAPVPSPGPAGVWAALDVL